MFLQREPCYEEGMHTQRLDHMGSLFLFSKENSISNVYQTSAHTLPTLFLLHGLVVSFTYCHDDDDDGDNAAGSGDRSTRYQY